MRRFVDFEIICLTVWILATSFVSSNTAITKRRLCIEYEIPDYRPSDAPLSKFNDTGTRTMCMKHCVRNFDCWAFNHHLDSATCILLPAAGCMTLGSHPGYLYIHLYECGMVPVWQSRRPSDKGWRWVKTSAPQTRNDVIELSGGYTRYVSRHFYKGLYLLGWYRNSDKQYRAISPQDGVMKCVLESGEFLAFNKTSDYSWLAFTAGDPVPDTAAAISTLQYGTPQYVTRKYYTDLAQPYWLPGYYDPDTGKNYYAKGGVANPIDVEILVLN